MLIKNQAFLAYIIILYYVYIYEFSAFIYLLIYNIIIIYIIYK